MEAATKKPTAPIVFVTGIGQTWSSLNGKIPGSWNLFPRSSRVIFNDFKIRDYANTGILALQSAISLLCGKGINRARARKCISSLLKYCVPNENGALSSDVNIRIYGARSFDKLRNIDFETGEYSENCRFSLLDRIYIDIPCKRLSHIYGEENLYCFNYSSFSRVYTDADNLRLMIEEVINDQKEKTGSDRVILVPMSMGATVVNAYLDKYGSDLISKVIGIVGAWNGSDALADLLVFNTAENALDGLDNLIGDKGLNIIRKAKKENLHKTLEALIDSFVESVLLKTTTFSSLIPNERYEEISKILFSEERIKRNEFLNDIKAESDRYHKAQANIRSRFTELCENNKTDFFFIGGYGLKFGEGSNDFGFLKMMNSSDKCDTDGVIRISSTVPCSVFLENGKTDPNSGIFPDRSWYFEGQKHELGTNNTALKLAFDIALGNVENVRGKYPQFNLSRDIKNAYALLDRAKSMLENDNIDGERKQKISSAVKQTENMLECIINDPEKDNTIIENLRSCVE